MSSDTRLIERWMPIAALGEESVRERRSMTSLPPTYYLHVWWARRPLIASRAAVLGCLLSSEASHDKFLEVLGIHGDPVETRRQIDRAARTGEDLGPDPYGYPRAFQYLPSAEEIEWSKQSVFGDGNPVVLDPTAGGGSIPFEASRLGVAVQANDLNPVAALLLNATVRYPPSLGRRLLKEFGRLSKEFLDRSLPKFKGVFPEEGADINVLGYVWARTVTCPYCDGLVPLSPNWRLGSDGVGERIIADKQNGPGSKGRKCTFEIVTSTKDQSPGTMAGGDASCPYDDCARVIDGDQIKEQAQKGQMGEQLCAVAYKQRIWTKTKNGKKKEKWVREVRAPRASDADSGFVAQYLTEKLPEWEAFDLIPNESIPDGLKTSEPIRYGMKRWVDLFSPRQLLCHGLSVETYRELLDAERARGELNEATAAAFIYLAIAIDTTINYGARLCRWDSSTERIRSVFDRHDFAFYVSYGEMAPMITGAGYRWALEKTEKCIRELIELGSGQRIEALDQSVTQSEMFEAAGRRSTTVSVTCKSADSLDHLKGETVDIIVMDPPYYDNVMYAELSDFFYVWLKRTAGHVMPELFRMPLTDKEHEAVANPAKFRGEKGATALAYRDYQDRMSGIFAECRRVLKSNGIMTLMFTHKATGAWDALTKGLMQAGFTITASWPINTEAEGSLHIKDKAAANSTIFLACRPRAERPSDVAESYWEEVEPKVAEAVRLRISEFQEAGIGGVDLYLASFGPALQKFSEHWPLRRGTPRPQPEVRKRRRQAEMFEEEWDPYEVTPEDALDAARREVKRWRLQQLTHMKARTDLDPLTSFYVLAWDAFKAPRFDYDEALRLGRAVGVDLEKDIIGHVAEKKASEIILWDSAKRAAKGALGPADGSRSWLDAVHHAAYAARSRNLQDAREMLTKAQVDTESGFFAALEAVLEVLPVSKAFSGIDLEGDVAEFGNDFEALENLRKLAFAEDVDEPQQLQLWKEEAAATEA